MHTAEDADEEDQVGGKEGGEGAGHVRGLKGEAGAGRCEEGEEPGLNRCGEGGQE